MLDFAGVYDPLTRLRSMGFLTDFAWDLCSHSNRIEDAHGLELLPSAINTPLDSFDLVVVAGGFSTRELIHDQGFLDWLRSAKDVPLIASVCTGSLLLGAAGFLQGKRATTHPSAFRVLREYCGTVVEDRVVDEGKNHHCRRCRIFARPWFAPRPTPCRRRGKQPYCCADGIFQNLIPLSKPTVTSPRSNCRSGTNQKLPQELLVVTSNC